MWSTEYSEVRVGTSEKRVVHFKFVRLRNEENLVLLYFNVGLKNKEIFHILAHQHQPDKYMTTLLSQAFDLVCSNVTDLINLRLKETRWQTSSALQDKSVSTRRSCF